MNLQMRSIRLLKRKWEMNYLGARDVGECNSILQYWSMDLHGVTTGPILKFIVEFCAVIAHSIT